MNPAARPANRRSSLLVQTGLLALACGLLPLFAVHLSYLISASAGYVPWCVPYWEGCTSISKAARQGLANQLFKGLVLPSAAFILVFWVAAANYLHAVSAQHVRRIFLLRAIGIIGALFLMLYATFLGVEGEVYQWMRRYGVTIYFSFTVLAQMLMASVLPAGWLRNSLGALCALMLIAGIASLPLQYFLQDRKATLNAIEWLYALLMTSGFALVGLEWLRLGLSRQPEN